MRNAPRTLLGFTLLTLSYAAQATTAALSDGAIVDWSSPGSRVWLLSDDGSRTPLWNGVYTLRDGGQLTIRNGVLATPPWSDQGVLPSQGLCQQLVNRVCGSDGHCSDSTACKLARQMDAMERQSGNTTDAPGSPPQCQLALRDSAFFKACQ
jgi:hypothetical protein